MLSNFGVCFAALTKMFFSDYHRKTKCKLFSHILWHGASPFAILQKMQSFIRIIYTPIVPCFIYLSKGDGRLLFIQKIMRNLKLREFQFDICRLILYADSNL